MPKHLLACHACDNPPCCNPAHIWPGTPGENTRDSVSKLRRVGERMGRAVLKEEDVKAIIVRLGNGEIAKDIAADYGVARCTIYRITAGKAWPHLTRGSRLPIAEDAKRTALRRVQQLQQAGSRKSREARRA